MCLFVTAGVRTIQRYGQGKKSEVYYQYTASQIQRCTAFYSDAPLFL